MVKQGKSKKGILFAIFSFLLLFDLVALSEFNNDWQGYQNIYDGVVTEVDGDIFFYFLMQIFNAQGYDYIFFNTILVTVIVALIVLFFYLHAGKNYVLFISFVLTLLVPNCPILLRFYLSFSLFLIAFHFYIKRRFFLQCLCIIPALLIHSGIVIFLPIFFIDYFFSGFIERKQAVLPKYLFIIALCLLTIKSSIFNLLGSIGLNVFVAYLNEATGLFTTIYFDSITLVWFVFAYYLHKKVTVAVPNIIERDEEYRFFLICIIYVFFFLGFTDTMILVIRLYEPLSLIALIFILNVQKYIPSYNHKISQILQILLFYSIFAKFFLPSLLTGKESEWLIHYIEILKNNPRSIILSPFI